MCHSRFTDRLARFAARPFPDHFLRQLTAISAAPENHDLLHAANAPLQPGSERYYHLDGSRDDSSGIAFLAGDGRRSHLLGIPLGLADPETQHDIVSVSLLRRRIWLNGGRGEGQEEDFRFLVDGRGTWIVRLRSADTPPDSAIGSPIDANGEDDEEGVDEYTNLLDIPDVLPRDLRSSQSGAFRLTSRQLRNQRRRVANTRLSDITTRINILRGIPHASTRLPGRFISSLNDIENLADQLRTMPPHIISEETFALFDKALDQLERTASLATLSSRRRGVTAEDPQPESDLSDNNLGPVELSSPPSTTQERPMSPHQPSHSPRPEDPLLTAVRTRRDNLITLKTIISTLTTFLSSRSPPPRSTISSIRRSFDEITILLARTDDPTVLDFVSTAQSLFWMLARRAFPAPQTAGLTVAVRPRAVVMRERPRFRSRSEARPVPAVTARRRRGVGRRKTL